MSEEFREPRVERWRVGREAKQTIWWGEHVFHGSVATCEAAALIVDAMNERTDLRAEVERLKRALGQVVELGDRCEECEVSGAPMATHITTHSVTGLPLFLCAACAKNVGEQYRKAESKGCGKQPEIEEHEQDTAVAIALAALGEGHG